MAEYQEVMHHLGRMCGTYLYCTDGCPLQEEPNVCFLAAKSLSTEKIEATEQAIMSWAAENPEPVYPTWEEWLADVGVLVCDTSFLNKRYWYTINKLKLEQPIPADIAEKLGLEEKEG